MFVVAKRKDAGVTCMTRLYGIADRPIEHPAILRACIILQRTIRDW